MNVEACPQCGCREFYRQKNFPRPVGLAIVIIGIALSFFTYGLSLIAVALLDGIIYLFLPWTLVCYQCRTKFRGVAIPKEIRPYDHHTGDRFRYETLARRSP